MDISLVLGLLLGVLLIGAGISMGGDIRAFIDLPSVLITFGGTLAATLVMFPLKTVIGSLRLAQVVLKEPKTSPLEIIEKIVSLAQKARRESILALENEPIEDPFLKKGIRLVVDGAEPDFIRTILETEIDMMLERHKAGHKVFTAMGTFSPAFGMIGTLIGLVQMLKSLDEPQKDRPSHGGRFNYHLLRSSSCQSGVFAHRFEAPGPIQQGSYSKEMMLEGVLSILAGENPRMIREKLMTFLPPSMRLEDHAQKEKKGS